MIIRAFALLVVLAVSAPLGATNALAGTLPDAMRAQIIGAFNDKTVWLKRTDRADATANFERRLDTWINERYPDNTTDRQSEIFTQNLVSALKHYPLDWVKSELPADSFTSKASQNLFDEVAFYTVASDADFPLSSRRDRSDWAKRDGTNWREAPVGNYTETQREWAGARQSFALFHRNYRAGPSETFYKNNDANDPGGRRFRTAQAQRPRADWTSEMESRFRRLYQDKGAPDIPGFYNDLAQIHYLMIGLEMSNNRPVLAGPKYLESLNAELEEAASLAAEGSENSSSTSSTTTSTTTTSTTATGGGADPASGQALLGALLTGHQQKNGFADETVIATGLLSSRDFISTLRGGYMLNDVGAGVNHGLFTHSLQWRIIMEDFRANPELYETPPIEIFQNIGRFDSHPYRDAMFGFERSSLLWGQLFDLASTNELRPDLTHPDGINAVLRSERPRFQALTGLLNEMTADRQAEGAEHLVRWNKIPLGRLPVDLPFIDQAAFDRLEAIEQDLEDRIQPSLSSERQALFDHHMADALYIERFAHDARQSGMSTATLPDENNVEQNVALLKHGDPNLLNDQNADRAIDAIADMKDYHDKIRVAKQRDPAITEFSDDGFPFAKAVTLEAYSVSYATLPSEFGNDDLSEGTLSDQEIEDIAKTSGSVTQETPPSSITASVPAAQLATNDMFFGTEFTSELADDDAESREDTDDDNDSTGAEVGDQLSEIASEAGSERTE